MSAALSWLVEPGFLSNSTVRTAALIGGPVAFTCAVVGTFTVLRRQSFAGEALGDVGTTGGSGAFLVNANPLWGFMAAGLVAAGLIQGLGERREHSRDLATGIVLGASLGLTTLFLYFDTTHSATTGATLTVLYGSLFVINASIVPVVIGLCALALVAVLFLQRVLLLSTLSPDLAAARGVPVRLVGGCYLVAMALAVSLAALTIGAVLSTALLVGPPAAALHLTNRPGRAMLMAGVLGVLATWLGILLAYDSYYWPPKTHGWPVSFLIVTLVFVCYLLASAVPRRHRGPAQSTVTAGAAAIGAGRSEG